MWMIPSLGLEMCGRIWKYFIKPDTEIAIRDYKDQVKKKKKLRSYLERLPQSKMGQFEFQKNHNCN